MSRHSDTSWLRRSSEEAATTAAAAAVAARAVATATTAAVVEAAAASILLFKIYKPTLAQMNCWLLVTTGLVISLKPNILGYIKSYETISAMKHNAGLCY